MKLYGIDLSTYVAKVQVVLRNKNVAYELVAPPDGYNSPAYRKISPLGSIPALVDNQVTLSESEAIVEYLEEVHPDPAMLPSMSSERAHARMLSRVHDTWVEPQLRALFPLIRQGLTDGADTHIDNFHMRLERFESVANPAPFLTGTTLGLADCAWPTTFAQARQLFPHFGRALEIPASLEQWAAHLDTHPAVQDVKTRCDTAMTQWMKQFANA